MKLYIVRHGQTIWNKEGRMQGAKNSNLTEKGISEAKKLNKFIKDINFDRVYVSPLGRTLETMEYVKGDMDLPVTIVEELQEMNFGKFEGEVLENLKDEYPEDIYNLWQNPKAYVNETGENYEELFERVEKGIDKILENKDREENVLVVTHGVIISTLLTIVKKKPIDEIWETPVVRNTSLSIVEYNGRGELEIVEENIIKHLN